MSGPPPPDDRLPRRGENPFSTRRIRPGAIPFVFPPGEDAPSLVERLRERGWRGEIVGPHGSGKSSLVATLRPAIEAAGRTTLLMTLHDGQRRLPVDLTGAEIAAGTVVMIDGYEQLSAWSRLRVDRACRRRNLGLLVTCHASVGLPPIYTTAVTPELARCIVARLVGDLGTSVAPQEVDARLARRQGNLREALFDLYDLYESRR